GRRRRSRSASGSSASVRRSAVRPPPPRSVAIPPARAETTGCGAPMSWGPGRHRDPATYRRRCASVWIAVLRAQLLLRATRVSAADAPPILEERQAREGEARKGNGSAEGKAESAAGRETRANRKGGEGRGEARTGCRPAETGRGGRLRD